MEKERYYIDGVEVSAERSKEFMQVVVNLLGAGRVDETIELNRRFEIVPKPKIGPFNF